MIFFFYLDCLLSGTRPPYDAGQKCIRMDLRTGYYSQSCCKIPAAYVCVKRADLPDRSSYVRVSSNSNTASWTYPVNSILFIIKMYIFLVLIYNTSRILYTFFYNLQRVTRYCHKFG